MKRSASKPAPKRSSLVEAIEFMKRGPLTQAQLPHIKHLARVILHLRQKGWPIATTMGSYHDQFGREFTRAEYRLVGNWANRPLPFGGHHVGKDSRKNHHEAAQAASFPEVGVPES
jgi:hypothetical protein